MPKRAAIIVTDAETIEWYVHARSESPIEFADPSEQLLADLRYLVNAAPGPESARVRAALGDDHE